MFEKNIPESKFGSQARGSKKTCLLHHAALEFSRKGYFGTTIKAVTQHCGLKASSFFQHFRSKKAIALASIEHLSHVCQRDLFCYVNKQALTSQERIVSFCNALADFFKRDDIGLTGLFVSQYIDEKLQEVLRDYWQTWFSKLHALLKQQHDDAYAGQLVRQSIERIFGAIILSCLFNNAIHLQDLVPELKTRWLESSSDERG